MSKRLLLPCAVCGLLVGCAPVSDGGYYTPSYGSSSSYSSTSEPAPSQTWDHTSVRSDGTIVENKRSSDGSSERTIIHPNGGVTIIQRDSDGTKTFVGSDGSVRVEPPGSHDRWR